MEEIDYNLEENKVEETEENSVPINVPFDPNFISIRRDPYTLGQLIDRIEYNEIDFLTGFQRKDGLWKNKQKCGLIESILLRLPLPAFYFFEIDDSKWQIIDGLQRTRTIKDFVVDKTLVLDKNDLEFLHQFNNCNYDKLPRDLQRRIKTTPLTVYVVEKSTPDEVKFNIFKRINTGGLILTPQEIRHALNQGIAADFVAELASLEQFKQATCNIIKTERMEDRDFVTRFVSFYLLHYQNYEPDLDSFLMKGMKAIKTEKMEKIKSAFIKAMDTAIYIFGNDAFRRRENINDRKKPLNKALFEVLSVNFSNLNDHEIESLRKKKNIFKEKFIEINRNAKLRYALTSRIGDKEGVQIRFSEIKRIIEETINSESI